MNTYTWDCKTIDVYPTHESLTEVVYNVHWRLTGKTADGEHSSTIIGTQSLELDTIQPEGFIAVAELTNEQVTSWVKEQMGAEKVSELEASLDKSIAEQVTPSTITMTIGSAE